MVWLYFTGIKIVCSFLKLNCYNLHRLYVSPKGGWDWRNIFFQIIYPFIYFYFNNSFIIQKKVMWCLHHTSFYKWEKVKWTFEKINNVRKDVIEQINNNINFQSDFFFTLTIHCKGYVIFWSNFPNWDFDAFTSFKVFNENPTENTFLVVGLYVCAESSKLKHK